MWDGFIWVIFMIAIALGIFSLLVVVAGETGGIVLFVVLVVGIAIAIIHENNK